jgi:hypothetical protein
MVDKIKLEDKEYSFDQLSEAGKTNFLFLNFVNERVRELNDHKALLQRARNSYVDSLKREMLSDKAGFLFEDN